jgi:Tol biopolymer transport system component
LGVLKIFNSNIEMKIYRNLLRGGFIRVLLIISFLLGWAGWSSAQLQLYNHPELKWRTIETDHFYVHFHQGEERTASLVAKIAEEIFEPITSLYGYVPDGKVHFIVRDHGDNSNGAAFYYDNKIEVWAPAMNFQLRGTNNWLRDVVSHEYSHIVSLGAVRKMPRQIPAIYFQWLDYEDEKRSDVLHGYPKTLMSFPMAGTVLPMWFAEGMAQYQRGGLNYDTWDTHRDMILRTAVMEDKLLSLTEMGFFGKNSLGNERVYNQGYGLTLYIAHHYGEEVLKDLARSMRSPWRISFSGAVKRVLGKSEEELYQEWVGWIRKGYIQGNGISDRDIVQGKILEERGAGNFHPVFSPDGQRVAYISNRGRDYLSKLSLRLYDFKTGKSHKLVGSVPSPVSWSHDSKKLVYAKKTARTGQGSMYFDLYTYDLESKKEKRLTRLQRANQPDWSPDGSRIVCVVQRDGTSNLAILNSDGKKFHKITAFMNGEKIYTPRWLRDGKRIVFAVSFNAQQGRDIAVIDSTGSGFDYLVRSAHDERDPVPGPEDGSLVYSSDRSGIFNLYSLDINTGKESRITDVRGGAFMPAVDRSGRVVYSLFYADGYRLACLDSMTSMDDSAAPYMSPYQGIRDQTRDNTLDIANYDDRKVPEYESRPYKPIYSKLSILPRVMVDFPGKLKIGAYFYGSDFLDRISLLGGVAVNSQFDADLFGMFQYKRFYPTLFLEAFYQVRHSSDEDVDYRFDLMEMDVGADWQLNDTHTLRTAYVYSRYSGRMTFTEQGQKIKFPYTYHIGSVLQARWIHRAVPFSVESGIAPSRGRKITVLMEGAWQRFLDGFEVHQKYGTVVEVYKKYRYGQVYLDWREYMPVPFVNHSLAFRLRAGIIDKPVENFYNFFAGGLDGIKGYPYYSIEGRKLFHLGLAYRLPIFRKMDLRFLLFNFDKLYLSLYADIGNAWDDGRIKSSEWKRDVGVVL